MTALPALPGSTGAYGRELREAIALARAAGAEVVRLRAGELGVEMKPGDEPVTVADRLASALIVAGIAAAFPDDPIISEELPVGVDALASPRVWLIDPIDGTKDFIRGGDGFAIMIGLAIGGVPTVGVVYQPTIDRLFFGTPRDGDDGGAHVLDRGALHPLAVSAVALAADARLVASASHRTADIDRVKAELQIHDELNIGSVGVKLCLIALGVRDLYVNPAAKTKAWDTCAPEAILAGAGGQLTDLFGRAIDYHVELAHRRGLVGSNRHVHAEVVARLGPLFPNLA